MSNHRAKLNFLKFICEVVGVNTPTTTGNMGAFCVIFNSTLEDLQDFNISTEHFVPVPWLDVLFPKMTSSQFEEYNILTAKICAPLKEPVFYTGIEQTTASRPDYGGPRSDPKYRAPYKRKISPIETISNEVLEIVGKSPRLQEFPTSKRLGDLIQMAINLSEKNGTVNRYLFKKVLGNMIPHTYTIRTSPLKTILTNKVTSIKSEFPFEEKVKFT